MERKTNLWLIRIYAILIIVIAIGDIFEGGTFKLMLTALAALILVQSSFNRNKKS